MTGWRDASQPGVGDEFDALADYGDAVAVIGMACRFPKADDIDAFWHNLLEGRECISRFSDEELREAGVSPATRDHPNFVPARAIIDEPEMFDAGFFGFSPAEAAQTDPQHRIFLECAWQALEHAGYDPATYERLIGIFGGLEINTYQSLGSLSSTAELKHLIGNDKDYLATRVAFKLNLRGPAVTVQTACSTSLVAVHFAVHSLLDFQTDIALAGGASIAFPQKAGYWFQEGGIFSPDGHCRAFDARASGTVGGEGVGLVALKRLDDALSDGDTIHAVIRGTGINNDGATKVGFTAPSVEGQSQAIAMAHAMADIDPASITYVETHGTGTRLGDPVEITALTEVFRAQTDKIGFCALGSLKTNVGHMSTAAGIGSLIKTVLAVKHRTLPPSLNFESPNPMIDFDKGPFFVNDRVRPWTSPDGDPLRAGVSSFGIGGTNAHVVVEQAPAVVERSLSSRAYLLLLSARTPEALERASLRLAAHLTAHSDVELGDVSHTLLRGRRRFEHHRIAVCTSVGDAVQAFSTEGAKRRLDIRGEPETATTVFLFSGQGAPYAGMAARLYQGEPEFRVWVDRACTFIDQRFGFDLRSDLLAAAGERQPVVSARGSEAVQPLILIFEVALARLWMSYGVVPDVMIGHSIGEIAAACVGGVFSLEDALSFVVARGRLVERTEPGAMLALIIEESSVPAVDGVSIAAVNAPNRVVVSGAHAALAQMEIGLRKRGVEGRRLSTTHAFHSPTMEPILDDLRRELSGLSLKKPTIPMISTVHGVPIAGDEWQRTEYWIAHCRRTVRFADAIAAIEDKEDRIILEVGPGRQLASLTRRQCRSQPFRRILTSTPAKLAGNERSYDVHEHFLTTVGQLNCTGVDIDWSHLFTDWKPRRIPLPTYPFERQRYAIERSVDTPRDAEITRGKRPDIRDWLYQPSWKRVPIQYSDREHLSEAEGVVLALFSSNQSELVRAIANKWSRVVQVEPGSAFVKFSGDHYGVEPGNPADYERLIECIISETPLIRIVHGWLLDSDTNAHGANVRDRGFVSVLHLMHACIRMGMEPGNIDIVTSGIADVVGTETIKPDKAMILGLCRTIPQEYPNIVCRAIDFTDDGDISLRARQLRAELNAVESNVVAYRGRYRWIEDWQPVGAAVAPTGSFTLPANGVYVITGGLGRIGLALANHLAQSGTSTLVLTGRRGLPPRSMWCELDAIDDAQVRARVNRITALESCGVTVEVHGVDVADHAGMSALFAGITRRHGRVDGVFHAAGYTGPGLFRPIVDIDREHIERHLAPKVHGLDVLVATMPTNVNFCVVLSSLVTVLGGLGSALYAVANQYMDSLVIARSRTGNTQWLAVDWDFWQMDDSVSDVDPWISRSTDVAALALSTREGVAVMERILALPDANRIVVSTEDLASRRVRPISRSGVKRDNPARMQVSRTALDSDFEAPHSELEYVLISIWEDVLGVDSLGINDNFFQLGGDSLTAIQLASRLRERLMVDFSVNELFDEPTVAAQAQRITKYREDNQQETEMLQAQLSVLEELSPEALQELLSKIE